MEEEKVLENYIDNKCPNCGSDLKFLPGSKNIKCVSCDSLFDIESLGTGDLDEYEEDLSSVLENIKQQAKTDVKSKAIHCEDCGGLINIDNKTVSTSCPFCGSSKVIIEDESDELIKITGVIPFVLTEEDVKRKFKEWIKGKLYAPTKLKKGRLSPSFKGFYIPYYTFDSDTISKYSGYRGDYYYTTRVIHTKNGTRTVRERHTRWTYRNGVVFKTFDDVLIPGVNNKFKSYVDDISHFNFKLMEKYQEKFLLGYYSERPSISLEKGFDESKKVMMNTIHNLCVKDMGGDTYRDLKFNVNYSDVTFKQIMAPIYNGHYEYNNNKYNFMCNGQTGKFSGKYPISPLKVALTVVIILIIVILIFVLVYYQNY